MKIFKKITDVQRFLKESRKQKKTIGFVPTMGALHEGHLQLVEASNAACDVTVASIFVNPTQFNDKKDLEKYPRTIADDIRKLTTKGCDVLFYPEEAEIYPSQEITRFYDLGQLELLLEGAFRPGHFQGVCQVVDRLFSIVQPDQVFFGQKDYQQCMVIKKLIDLTPAFAAINMQMIPTIREASGLAMSSRNLRLTEEEQDIATTLYQTLLFIKDNLGAGPTDKLIREAGDRLQQKGFKTDYLSIADAQTFQPVIEWDGEKPVVALVAAFLGNVRLIDNLVIA